MSRYRVTGRKVRAPDMAVIGAMKPVQIDSDGSMVVIWRNARAVWAVVLRKDGRAEWVEIAVNPEAPP